MIKPCIEVSHDEVKIENNIMLRPTAMSAKQWIDFWESVVEMEPEKEERLRGHIVDLEREVEELEDLTLDLKAHIARLENGED